MSRGAWLLALPLLLAGCGIAPLRQTTDPGLLWELRGRVVASDGDERHSGSLFWRQETAGHHLEISGPFGQGGLRVIEDASGARLETGDGGSFRGADTMTLLRDHVGWRLPIAGLRFWATGRPNPATPYRAEKGPEGRLVLLEQEGWQLRFGGYQEVGDRSLPRRITLRREALRVRLVVDEWRLPTPAGG